MVVTSSATGQGLDVLADELLRRLPAAEPAASEESEPVEHRVFRPGGDRSFRVEPRTEGGFRVPGPGIERLIARHDLGNEDALAYVEHRLGALGVLRALADAGFQPGDDVEIAGTVFELDPEA